MIPEDNKPYFFKIIYDGHTTEQLRIPPHFMKYILKEVSHRAILKGPSGGHWHIKLCENVDGMYLQDGWQEFLRDHSLGDDEFLLFRYDGNMFFNVQIFDKNGCERVDVSVTTTHRDSGSTEKRKRGRPRKNSVGSLHLHQSKSCKDGPGQHLPCHKSNKLKKFKHKIKIEEEDLLVEEMESQFKKVKEEKDTQSKIKTEEMDLPIQEIDSHTRRKFLRRQPPTEEGRARVWKTAESFTSNIPYFKSYLHQFSVQSVFIQPIPRSFSRTHLPNFKTKIVLRNSEGKSWVVNTIPNAGKHSFCGGWRAFVSGNKLKKGDICIFELVNKNEMQVHFF